MAKVRAFLKTILNTILSTNLEDHSEHPYNIERKIFFFSSFPFLRSESKTINIHWKEGHTYQGAMSIKLTTLYNVK